MATAPIVFQCGACRRVISDSNQLVAAVAELDALVLDGVIGVSVTGGDATYASLQCSACKHPLGRQYSQPPQPSLENVVHREEAPRYTLSRVALESYVLGSAQSGPSSNGTNDAGQSSATAIEPATRIEALETSEADVRLQLAQVMRVVLALDQRLRSLEDVGPERKRSR